MTKVNIIEKKTIHASSCVCMYVQYVDLFIGRKYKHITSGTPSPRVGGLGELPSELCICSTCSAVQDPTCQFTSITSLKYTSNR